MIARSVLMVKPAAFGFNTQTAVNNAFQHELSSFTAQQIQDIALLEFNNMVDVLRDAQVEVIVVEDQAEDGTPDSIFPNNWFTTFTDEVVLYGMYTENRKKERKADIIKKLADITAKKVNEDLLQLEKQNIILEGTGSLVCDYASKTAFAAISPRTDEKALDKFEEISGYKTVRFKASGPDGAEIYHTNVMMTMGANFVVIGLDTVAKEDRQRVIEAIEALEKEIIDLSNEQVFDHFAGNMLQLASRNNDKYLVMSAEARSCLTTEQINRIQSLGNRIIAPPLHMIEKIGGGSARCMMAEIFKNE